MDYRALAMERRFEWAGPVVQNVHAKTWWICGEGHRWEASYSSIQQRHGCPHCADIAPKVEGDYWRLAGERNFEWLGPFPGNVAEKTWWRCLEGHEWEAPYRRISRGDGCPYCAGNVRKLPVDYHRLAKGRGFGWVGLEVSNVCTKTEWICGKGHRWKATYNDIYNGNGCPECAADARRFHSSEYHLLAEECGFRWLGPEVPNTMAKTWWRCERGHNWETTYNSICRGNGCPYCVDFVRGQRVSKPQRQVCSMVGGELNYPVGRRRIDVALPDKMIAIEYDSWWIHGCRAEKDYRRNRQLLSVGWKVLCIKANKGVPMVGSMKLALGLLEVVDRVDIVLDDWGKGGTIGDF